MTTATKTIQTERQATTTTPVLEADPPFLAEKIANCRKETADAIRRFYADVAKTDANNLEKMWRLGRQIKNLQDDKHTQPKTGSKPVDPIAIMAALTSNSIGYMNKMARFYELYDSEAEFKAKFLTRRLNTGKAFTWAHMEQIIKFYQAGSATPRSLMDRLVEETFAAGLSAEQIEERWRDLQNKSKGKESRGGGRPISVPKTFDARAVRLIGELETLGRSIDAIYLSDKDDLLSGLKDMSQSEVAKQAEQIRARSAKLSTQLEDRQMELQSIRRRLLQVNDYVAQCESATAVASGKAEAAELEADAAAAE